MARSGDQVRITAQLIDARADKHLWAKTFERKSSDVLALQAELASAIAREINVRLTEREQSRLAAAPSVRSREPRRLPQGTLLLQSPERREPAEGDRAVRRGGEAESDVRPGVLGIVGRVPLGRLQRGVHHRLRSETQSQGGRREGGAARQHVGGSAHVARDVQAVLRIGLAGVRARISPGDRAQPELRLRARPVRAWRWRSPDGSTNRLPRAGARRSWTRSRRRC